MNAMNDEHIPKTTPTASETRKDDRSPAELSRRIVSASETESKYQAGYTTFVVKSVFTGPHTLRDLLYGVARQNLLGGQET